MKAILVGAGTIGARHLQGLALSASLREVVVVDPSPESRVRAEALWAEVPAAAGKTLRFADLAELVNEPAADFALVATLSAGRGAILDGLLASGIRAILLEKILFQSVADYRHALDAVAQSGADVRANLPYRMVPFFQAIRRAVAGKRFEMVVDNGDRGLGCNGVHFYDLFEYLANAPADILKVVIDKPIQDNRRGSRYTEFSGSATLSGRTGATATVAFVAGVQAMPCVTVRWDGGEATGDWRTGTATATDAEIAKAAFFMPMASQIAHQQMDEIVAGTSPLPTLAETFSLNVKMLAEYCRELGLPSDECTPCPIT